MRPRRASSTQSCSTLSSAVSATALMVGQSRGTSPILNCGRSAFIAQRGMTICGFVTLAHFTCQHRCALKDRTKENQSLGALDVGAKSTENGLFLASVTMPERRFLA